MKKQFGEVFWLLVGFILVIVTIITYKQFTEPHSKTVVEIIPIDTNSIKIKKGHTCMYPLCPFKGLVKFKKGCGNKGCIPKSACWILDSIHFCNPYLTYDGRDSIFMKLPKNQQNQ